MGAIAKKIQSLDLSANLLEDDVEKLG